MSQREEDLGVYEMLWDCGYCGEKKLLGQTHRHCGTCGAAQDPSWRYFPSDADKVAVKDHPLTGADFLCPFCKAPQSAKASRCTQCGGALDGAKQAWRRGDQVVAEGQGFAGESQADAKREKAAQASARPVAGAHALPPKRGRGRWIAVGVLGGIAVLAIGLATCWKREGGLTITGHVWERRIEIESLSARAASDWCEQMPRDAMSVTRAREVRSQDKVQDGEECQRRRVDNGDGTFKERKECKPKFKSVPVYGEKCHYTALRWGSERTVKAGGDNLDALAWPDPSLRGPNERAGARTESYTLRYTSDKDGKPAECTVDEARWRAARDGSKWIAPSRVLTGGVDCKNLKPAR